MHAVSRVVQNLIYLLIVLLIDYAYLKIKLNAHTKLWPVAPS